MTPVPGPSVAAWPEEESILASRTPDPQDHEARTIVAARGGDPAAREQLVRHWTPIVHRFATRILGDEHGARDATQETMIKVLRHLDRYDETRSFKTWVLSIARNTCVDAHRKNRRYTWEEPRDIASASPSPLQEVTRAESARAVREALGDLPAMYREILVLYHFEHLKYTEIAETLELPLGTVMNRIFRARRKLRDALGEAP